MNLLADLSSQLAAVEAAAAAARSRAELLLMQARNIAPQHRLASHDNRLLSAHGHFEPDYGYELLGERELQYAARLARDSMALFPLRVCVTRAAVCCANSLHCCLLLLTSLLQEAAYLLAR